MALLRTATKFSSTYSQRVVQHNTRTTIRTTSQPKVLSANYSLWQKNSVNEIKTPLAASTNATRWYATGDVIDIKVPPMGDSITEGVLHTWVKAKGDSVDVDETIGQIETDKVEVDIRAPTAGTITDLLVEESDTVQVDQKIAVLTEGAAAAKPAEPAKSAEPAKAQTEAPKKEEAKKPEQPKSAPTPPPTAPKVDKPAGSGERRERMRPIRVRTAERLKASQNTAALLTTFQHANLGNLIEMRTTHKDAFLKKHGVKLGFMSAFVKASCNALQQFPIVNAHIDGNDIVHKDSVDISIAVATPRGLLVPVLRQVENMSFADVEKTIGELGKKGKENKISVEEMQGGTFTISNGGVYGSMMGTPIINPPQSAILGMHGIQEQPVVVNGEIVIRPMMYLALTYDHRLIDGRDAVLFLRKIKEGVEDPRTLLLDL